MPLIRARMRGFAAELTEVRGQRGLETHNARGRLASRATDDLSWHRRRIAGASVRQHITLLSVCFARPRSGFKLLALFRQVCYLPTYSLPPFGR